MENLILLTVLAAAITNVFAMPDDYFDGNAISEVIESLQNLNGNLEALVEVVEQIAVSNKDIVPSCQPACVPSCQPACPDNFISLDGHCYFFSSYILQDWNDARDQCHKRNSKAALLSIETETEWNVIKDYLLKIDSEHTKSWWIGGNDQEKEGHWVWEGTKKPFEFKFWCPGWGNDNKDGSEHYTHIYWLGNFCWNDIHHTPDTSFKMYFICEV